MAVGIVGRGLVSGTPAAQLRDLRNRLQERRSDAWLPLLPGARGRILIGAALAYVWWATTKMTLNAAMNRYADGDDAAFSEIYDELAPRLYGYLFRQTRNAACAEDLLQQTLLHMHCARGTFKEGADVLPWAFAIAKRLFIDEIRRRRHEVSLEQDGGESPVDEALCSPARGDQLVYSSELRQSVVDKLERLPERNRTAFLLVKIDGLSPHEAAQVLGSTAGAVRVRVHRACQLLLAPEQPLSKWAEQRPDRWTLRLMSPIANTPNKQLLGIGTRASLLSSKTK